MRNDLSSRRERGVAALFVTVLLCAAMVLAVALSQRSILVEERRSANDYRAAQAFEAAEAGLDWALARVNDPTRLDDACRPSADPAALSWRDRMLRVVAPAGTVVPATWNDGGVESRLQSACVRNAAGWTCSCPSSGRPTLPVADAGATAPAFSVELVAATRPGLVRVVASGCTRPQGSGACASAPAIDHEAASRHEAIWAWAAAIRSAPVAALTARGDVDAGGAALGIHNPDRAGGGLAVHAGGRLMAPALRLSGPGGSSLGASIASGDADLASLTRDRFFGRFFGMSKDAWSRQPAVKRLACVSDCAAAMASAFASGHRVVFVDGDLDLAGPATFGSVAEPVIVVAAGALRLRGAVTIHGVAEGASLDWNDVAAGAARVQGAALVEGDYAGNGAPDVVHDAALLAVLKTRAGSFIRVNGSWKDF